MASYENLNIARLANKALEGLCKALLPLTAFSTNYSAQPGGAGSNILVPLTGSLNPIPFAGNYAICGGTKSVITVSLSSHSFVSVGQNDMDALNNNESKLDSFFYQAGMGLGISMLQDVLSAVTTSAFGFATSTTGVALDIVHIRKGKLELDRTNAPQDGRVALVDCVGMDALLSVTAFVSNAQFWDNSVLKEGRVNRALGFDFFSLNNVFSPAANSVMAFLAYPSALATAMRYVAPQKPEMYEVADPYSDPTTGATLGLRKFYDTSAGADFMILEANWGKAAGITRAGRIIGHNGTL
jgi:hypothetical protein